MTINKYVLVLIAFGQLILLRMMTEADAAALRGLPVSRKLLDECKLELELLIDTSGSISKNDIYETTPSFDAQGFIYYKKAYDAFKDSVIPAVRSMVDLTDAATNLPIVESGSIKTFDDLTTEFAAPDSSREELRNAINLLLNKKIGGSTTIRPALEELYQELSLRSSEKKARTIPTVITDGYVGSEVSAIGKKYKEQNIKVACIFLGQSGNYPSSILDLCDKDRVFQVANIKDFEKFVRSFASTLCNIIIPGYAPTMPPISNPPTAAATNPPITHTIPPIITKKPTSNPTLSPSMAPTVNATSEHSDPPLLAWLTFPAAIAIVVAAVIYNKHRKEPNKANEKENVGRADIAGTKKKVLGTAFTDAPLATRGMATFDYPKDATYQYRNAKDAADIESALAAARDEEEGKRSKGYSENPHRILGDTKVTAQHREPGKIVPEATTEQSFFETMLKYFTSGDDTPENKDRNWKLFCCCCYLVMDGITKQQKKKDAKPITPFSSKTSSASLSVSSGYDQTIAPATKLNTTVSKSNKVPTPVENIKEKTTQTNVIYDKSKLKPVATPSSMSTSKLIPETKATAAPIISRPAQRVESSTKPVTFTKPTVTDKPSDKGKVATNTNPVVEKELSQIKTGGVKDRVAALNKNDGATSKTKSDKTPSGKSGKR